jgi:asparagine synthase (glutamine-hydrolysing)
MCGVAGYWGFSPPSCERLGLTSEALAHRGPDGEGIYTHQSVEAVAVALVHRRLAIIDQDARSNQPFRLANKVLIFNGEIYNYIELRRQLKALGHEFKTEGDTEVLACALLQWGEEALDHLEGMWAFAWYDEHEGTLLLSRDRFGEKPLYLWQRDDGLYFSSEVKGLAALAGDWPEANQNHLMRYLINGYKAIYKTKETFYQGVEELPAGTSVRLSGRGGKTLRRYWSPRPSPDERMSYGDAVAMTREALIASVRLRMRSDVPLAFCMSGGVDSNSLISIAQRILGCDVHGFTIMNSDARYEEEDLVRSAVSELGVRHTAVYPERGKFLENLRMMVRGHDAPVATISYYVHWQLMQAIAAEGYKVTISGTGADELFTGYYDHHNLYLYEMSSDAKLHASAKAAWQQHLSAIVRNPYLKDPDLYVKDPTVRDHIYLDNDKFSSWLHKDWGEPFTEDYYVPGLLRNRMMNELFAEAVPVILHEDDLNAMCFSMENRSPFLDRQLFDVAYAIPERHLVQDGRAKAVLRDAMRGIVPDAILDSRRKVGFNAPILDLIDVKDKSVRDYILDDSSIYTLIRRDKIEEVMSKAELPNSVSKFLFYFLNIKIFLEIMQ